MFQQLDDAKPKPSTWLLWAGLILGVLNLTLGIHSELRHKDFSLVWLANGVGWLLSSGLGWLRLRKGSK